MYVKSDVNYLDIPSGMFPNLVYSFASPGVVNTNAIAKDIANNYYKEKDFELLKNLYFFRFATLEQLEKILNIDDEAVFKARLNQLLSRRIINKFTLSYENNKDASGNPDALVVYCLDFSGVELLSHKYQKNNIINYNVGMNIQDSNLVGKKLFIVDFYIKLINSIGKENIVSFDPSPEYPINKVYEGGRATVVRFRPNFSFSVNKDGVTKNYVSEIFTSEELGQTLIDEINYVEEFLPKTKSFFGNEDSIKKETPTLLLFTNKDDDMLLVTQAVISNAPSIKTYRLSTIERVKNGLGENGAFFKFEEGSLKPVTMGAFKR